MPRSSSRSTTRRAWRGLPLILVLGAIASAVSCQLSVVVAGQGGRDAGLALLLATVTGTAAVILLVLALHVAGRAGRHLTTVPPYVDRERPDVLTPGGLDEAWVQREAARGTRQLDAWRRSQAS